MPIATAFRSRWWQFAFAQFVVMGAGLIAIALAPRIPAGLALLATYSPFLFLAVALSLSLPFNRGRAALAVAGLGLVCVLNAAGALASPSSLLMAQLLVPTNIAWLAMLRERGAWSRYAARRAGFIVLQALLAAWLVSRGTWDQIASALPHGGIGAGIPIALAVSGLALVVTSVVVWLRSNAIDAALSASVVSTSAAFWMVDIPFAFPVLMATAAFGIVVGLLQDAHRYAFVDELTGLPSRRALEEKLLALPERYTIAMVDVDHFKRVNDDHGHEIGDQVLRMLAVHLARVGGGARAYRYGGEEFTALFPGRSARDAVPHLEALRVAVANYALQVRAQDRPAAADEGAARRGRERRTDRLQVTISIGLAERDGRNTSPTHVLRAADQALYRAKERGRNRLSR